MKEQHAMAFEAQIKMETINGIEQRIAKLKNKIGEITVSNNDLFQNPHKALCKMKEEQLAGVLNLYGKVDMAQFTSERTILEFARLQAQEALIRSDLASMSNLVDREKQYKKQLEIAKRVLAEKLQPGGRQ